MDALEVAVSTRVETAGRGLVLGGEGDQAGDVEEDAAAAEERGDHEGHFHQRRIDAVAHADAGADAADGFPVATADRSGVPEVEQGVGVHAIDLVAPRAETNRVQP